MSFLDLVLVFGVIATAGFFAVYTEALRQGVREGKAERRQPKYDEVGRTIIFGVKAAFIVGIAVLVFLTLIGAEA